MDLGEVGSGRFPGNARFQLIRKLGEGGMGVVYEALDAERGIHVALKTVRDVSPQQLLRFKREFRSIANLGHPNLVTLYELVAEGTTWFFTMELLEGLDFVRWVRPRVDERPDVGLAVTQDAPTPARITADTHEGVASPHPLSDAGGLEKPTGRRVRFEHVADEPRLRSALRQLAEALVTIHEQRIVHQDLKPSNVMVTPRGRLVLMDFGIVVDPEAERGNTARRTLVGTPAFMAPEQVRGDPVTAATDWYGLGGLLYLALTGYLPFHGPPEAILLAKRTGLHPPSPSEWIDGVPEDLELLCLALLDPDPAARPSASDVLARLGGNTQERRMAAPDRDVFVGRESELHMCRAAYGRSRTGVAALFVDGQSGIGKSTLIRHFLDEVTAGPQPPRAVLTGRCHERENLPYKGFDGVVDRLSQLLRQVPEERRQRLVPPDADLLARLFPVMRWFGGERPPSASGTGEPGDDVVDLPRLRARAFAALRVLLGRLAAEAPIVVHVDDLQWADRETLDLLSELLRPGERAPQLLVLGTMRDERTPAHRRVEQLVSELPPQRVHWLQLGPLSADEQEEMVDELLAGVHVSAEASRRYWRASEGNPLFVAELARFVLDRLARQRPEESSHAAPLTFEDALLSRLSKTSESARRVASAAMVAGEPLPLSVLAVAAEVAAGPREQALAALRSGNFLRVTRQGSDPWVDAFHDRVREAVLSSIDLDQLTVLHQRLAGALTAWGHAKAETLARHFLEAGDGKEAARHFERAAADAYDKLAFDRAAELYQAALLNGRPTGDARLALLESMGHSLVGAGRGFEASEVFRQAARDSTGQRAWNFMGLVAEQLMRSGHMERAQEALGEVLGAIGLPLPRTPRAALLALAMGRARLALRGRGRLPITAKAIDPDHRARLELLYSASTALGMLDYVQGGALHTRHLLAALDAGDEHHLGFALAAELVYRSGGRGRSSRSTRKLRDRVADLVERGGDLRLRSFARLSLGMNEFFGGRFQAARQHFEAAEHAFTHEVTSARWERVTSYTMRLRTLINLGELHEVARLTVEYLADAALVNDRYAHNALAAEASTWRLLRDDLPDDAEAMAREALIGWPPDRYSLAHYREALARLAIHLYRGQHHEAIALARDTEQRMRRALMFRVPYLEAHLMIYRGLTALAGGELEPIADAARSLAASKIAPYVAYSHYLRAALSAAAGNPSRARAELEEAVRGLDATDYQLFGAPIRWRLGKVIGGDEGARHVAQAMRWASDVGVAAPEHFLRVYAPALPGL